MPQASQLSPEGRFFALFVGPKHSGKTCAAASFLSDGLRSNTSSLLTLVDKRLKIHDYDGRVRGILDAPWLSLDRIDYDYYPPKGGKRPFYEQVNDEMEALQANCNIGQNLYETLVEDSLTSYTQGLIQSSLPLTHGKKQGGGTAGKSIGTTAITGPDDYNFESNNTYGLLAHLRSLPIPNIICTAHVIPRFGKIDPDNPYSESVEIGEKLSLRDKIGAGIGIYFDHIFRFHRKMEGQKQKFYVEFISNIACTSFPGLQPGMHDITGVHFKSFMLEKVRSSQSGQTVQSVVK